MSHTEFLQWFRGKGGYVHPSLDLFANLPNGDRGVVANGPIEEGANLVIVPVSCTMHLPTLDQLEKSPESFSDAVAYMVRQHAGTSPFLGSVLALLAELAKKGGESAFGPYLQSLPEDCNCLLSWTKEEMAELKGTTIQEHGEPPEAVFTREVQPRIAGKPELWPVPFDSLQQFLRVAGLVQSRAFHLEAENWVTGTRQEGADLFLIPAIDMINHSTEPSRRNTTLHKFDTPMSVEVDGQTLSFESFFAMKAERALQAGDQVLHSYGNLSDAQLLQTYGFVDLVPEQQQQQQQQEPKDKDKAKGKGKGGAKGKGAAASEEEEKGQVPALVNPHDYVTVPWPVLVSCCRSALDKASEGDQEELSGFDESLPQKLALLKSGAVFGPGGQAQGPGGQAQAEAEPQFVVTRKQPLDDTLLTSLQVLLMAKDEVEELQRGYQKQQQQQLKRKKQKKKGQQDNGSGSGAGGSSSTPEQQQGAEPAPLSLGTELLEQDEGFAQVVALAIIQIVDVCMARYPTTAKEDARLLKHAAAGGSGSGGSSSAAGGCRPDRLRLAMLVRLGEKDVLQQLKKRAVMIMMGMPGGGDDEQQEEGGGGSGSKRSRKDKGKGKGKGKAAGKAAEKEKEVEKEKEKEKEKEGCEEEDGEDEDEDDSEDGGEEEDEAEELGDGERELLDSDDSDKVGYAEVDFDDGIGEAHDRLQPHQAPKDDE